MTTKDVFNTFLTELQEESLRKLLQRDEEYRENEKKLVDLAEKVVSHIKTLDSELQEIFQTYNEVRCIQEGRNRDYLYLQGIKEGVKLMRFLEII